METGKGAISRGSIPPATLAALNAGTVPARNLVEGLAIDFRQLLAAVAPSLPATAIETLDPKLGITRRMALATRLLLDHGDDATVAALLTSPSDTVRGWAAYVVGLTPKLTLKQRLTKIRPLAADPHFGVREWAWLAFRPHVAADVTAAVKLLTPWTSDPSPHVRRFASEVTRPRGVWCSHIVELKASPELGLPILEPLRADPEKYVQDSVANWLNDAAKASPAWVRDLCRRWQRESDTPATRRICKRASRSL